MFDEILQVGGAEIAQFAVLRPTPDPLVRIVPRVVAGKILRDHIGVQSQPGRLLGQAVPTMERGCCDTEDMDDNSSRFFCGDQANGTTPATFQFCSDSDGSHTLLIRKVKLN